MIGNDVVDLGDPEARPAARHPRFDERVFTPTELRMLEGSGDANVMRWRLWACKESAYKLVKRRTSSTVFSPRTFEVKMTRPGGAEVHHEAGSVSVQVTIEGDAIHAAATWREDHDKDLIWATGMTESDPREAVRRLARQRLAREFECTPDTIEITAGANRIPQLRVDGGATSGFISLSHHGRFVGFACLLLLPTPRMEEALTETRPNP